MYLDQPLSASREIATSYACVETVVVNYIKSQYNRAMDRNTKEQRISKIYENLVGGNNLVIGCGIHDELEILACRYPEVFFFGIDIDLKSPVIGKNFSKSFGDALKLSFPDHSFEFIYCFHVLEHVSDPLKVIFEMRRVLKPGGKIFLGTPNKSRIFGYLTSDASFAEKLKWNLGDWKNRFKGTFENNLGAHAGFTKEELEGLFKKSSIIWKDETSAYYKELHFKHTRLIELLSKYKLLRFLSPSIYYTAHL
jgi:ubiquinone/menaquinone biosynthesis C-methylase UbiE